MQKHKGAQMDKKLTQIAAFGVSLVTVFFYLPSLENSFVNIDDNVYVYENPYIHSLNLDFLKWVFASLYAGFWHPLTLISYAVDFEVWGLNPFGYHMTSIVLHGLNTFLVVIFSAMVINRCKDINALRGNANIICAVAAGILFGLHPLHVEPVAWISERKDLLCFFFFMLSLLCYLQYAKEDQGSNNRYYLLSIISFFFSLLSKSMSVILPAILILLDWYPLERISKRRVWAVLMEKVPFFMLSLIFAALTIIAERSVGAVVPLSELPMFPRIIVGISSSIGYLVKVIYPSGLIPLYPYPMHVSFMSIEFLVPIALAFAITLGCLVASRVRRGWLAIWSCYVVSLLPVMGIIKIGEHSVADRYMYLPSIGPFLLIGVGAALLHERVGPLYRKLLYLLAIAIIVGMSYVAQMQIRIWKNGETLWTHEIRNKPTYSRSYINRADYYIETGRYEEALKDIDQAISLSPGTSDPFYFRGLVYLKQDSLALAFNNLTNAISLNNPPDYSYYKSRGDVFMKLGRYEQALRDYMVAIKMCSMLPDLPNLYNDCGRAYLRLGQDREAMECYRRAKELSPIATGK